MIQWWISSTVLIGIVFLLRQVLKGKISLRFRYALWLLVAVRLLLPFNPADSGWSILNFINLQRVPTANEETNVKQGEAMQTVNPLPLQKEDNTEIPFEEAKPFIKVTYQTPEDLQLSVNPVKPQNQDILEDSQDMPIYPDIPADMTELPGTGENPKTNGTGRFFIVWITVAAAGFLIVVASNVYFFLRLYKTRKTVEGGYAGLAVYETRVVCSPCLFGIPIPAIYLPRVQGEEAMRHILAHEYTHYRHFDHIWAFVRIVCVCLHWYNPAVWLAAYFSGKDCELACDEGAIERLGESSRTAYGQTLVEMVARQSSVINLTYGTTMMTGTDKGIRERIVHIARKTASSKLALGVLAVCILAAVAVTFTGERKVQADVPQSTEPSVISGISENGERDRLTQILYDAGGYEDYTIYHMFPADYDRDGVEDAVIMVFLTPGENWEMMEPDKEYTVDIWYYDGAKQHIVDYCKGTSVLGGGEHCYVAELSDKTFFVCEESWLFFPYGGDWQTTGRTRLLGVSDGKLRDYLNDEKREKFYDGRLMSFEGNDLTLVTCRHVGSERYLTDSYDRGYKEWDWYLYYDPQEDAVFSYPSKAVSESEVLQYGGMEENLRDIRALFVTSEGLPELSYAVTNGIVSVTAAVVKEQRTQEKSYYYYNYRMEGRDVVLTRFGNGLYAENYFADAGDCFVKKEASKEQSFFVSSAMTAGSRDTSVWSEEAFENAVWIWQEEYPFEAVAQCEDPAQLIKLAYFEQEQVTVYGNGDPNDRLIVEYGNERQVYEIPWLSGPQVCFPEFSLKDYDEDSRMELFASYCAATGSGVSLWNCLIFDSEDTMFDRMYEVRAEGFLEMLGKPLEYSYQNGLLHYGIRERESYEADISETLKKNMFDLEGIGTGGILSVLENETGIFVNAPLESVVTLTGRPYIYLGEFVPKGYPDGITAKVNYLGNGTFEIVDIHLAGNLD